MWLRRIRVQPEDQTTGLHESYTLSYSYRLHMFYIMFIWEICLLMYLTY